MPRPAAGRRARLLLAAVCLAAATIAALDAQTDTPQKYSRLQRLEQWTTAVERHEPGQADGTLNTFDDWSAREFTELKIVDGVHRVNEHLLVIIAFVLNHLFAQ